MTNVERTEKEERICNQLCTSDANDNRFISPPEIPLILPGTPIIVSLHFVKPSYEIRIIEETTCFEMPFSLSFFLRLRIVRYYNWSIQLQPSRKQLSEECVEE